MLYLSAVSLHHRQRNGNQTNGDAKMTVENLKKNDIVRAFGNVVYVESVNSGEFGTVVVVRHSASRLLGSNEDKLDRICVNYGTPIPSPAFSEFIGHKNFSL
jgi:hypothetical protein